MIYTLFIWTVVGSAGWSPINAKYDWRALAELHDQPPHSALEKCETAAKQLGLKEYRCVRTK